MRDLAETNLPAKDVLRHLAHELRQPLSALESIAFYLQMTAGEGDSSRIAAQVNRIQQMVDSANFVLSDMLHTLQMAPAHPRRVDLAEIAEEVLTESWACEGLTIYQDFDAAMECALADEEQCRHLMRSVMQFFYRSADEPRAVWLSGRSANGVVYLEARANAPGVSPEHLFGPLEPNQLYTCLRIAENNNGHFRAEKDDRGLLRLFLDLPAF